MTPAVPARRAFIGAALGLAAGGVAAASLHWHERSLVALGTTLRLRLAAGSAAQASAALDAAVAAVRRVEAAMSLFRPDSELVRLNREGRLESPSANLRTVLQAALRVAQRSGGAFDPTVQPLWQAYEAAHLRGRLPNAAELRAARQAVGWRGVRLRADAVVLRPGMALTLNGIAQGHAADAAREALRARGVAHALLDCGETAAWGRSPRGDAWTLAIEDPRDPTRALTALRCDGRAVATSADHRSTFSPDRRHHHILDPATGDSPPALSSVTVLAPSAMQADALTKVMFIAGPARIAVLAHAWGVGVLWVDKAGRWQATPDLRLAAVG